MTSVAPAPTEERTDKAVYAGFWVRVLSVVIDALLIALCAALLAVFDLLVMNGELGSFDYYEVTENRVVEERTEESDDGGVTTYTKTVETKLDYQGRSATTEIEKTVTTKGDTTWTSSYSTTLKADPGWGGKYALAYDRFTWLAIIAYFFLMWSSKHQATLGGRAMKLRVTGYDDRRISRLRALGRLVAAIPSVILAIPFVMVVFTKRKQALHDKIAKTLVLRDAPTAG